MKLKPTKEQIKMLKKLARELPESMYAANIIQWGHEVIAKGITHTVHGEPIKPNSRYPMAVKYPVNHESRIIKAYKDGGMEAVKEYCSGVQEVAFKEAPEINLHSQMA